MDWLSRELKTSVECDFGKMNQFKLWPGGWRTKGVGYRDFEMKQSWA
jgi:ribosome modulation factor